MDFEKFIGTWTVQSTEGNPRCTSAAPACTITIGGTQENPTVSCQNSHRYPSPSWDSGFQKIRGGDYELRLELQGPNQRLRLVCGDNGKEGAGATGSWTANDDRPPVDPPLS